MALVVDLDVMLARRKMSVGDFAAAVGITPPNVAVLKNGRARAIRFSTLDAICRVLDCQPGDILRWIPDEPRHDPGGHATAPSQDPV
jgi:putative transcriptional regulator